MYSCESWTIKKAECWRIDTFKLWCWRRLLRVSWTAKRSSQSILKEINPENSLEGLMLKLQYFGHLMWIADSLENTLMLGRTEGRGRRGWQRMRWLNGISGHEIGQTSGDGQGQGGLERCSPWDCEESDITKWLNNNNITLFSYSLKMTPQQGVSHNPCCSHPAPFCFRVIVFGVRDKDLGVWDVCLLFLLLFF